MKIVKNGCKTCKQLMDIDHVGLVWRCPQCGRTEQIVSSAERRQAEETFKRGVMVHELDLALRACGKDEQTIERIVQHLRLLQEHSESKRSQLPLTGP